MYQIGDKFYNTRRGGILTIVDVVTERVFGLGDVPFIRYKYFIRGTVTGQGIWVIDEDIDGWLDRGVLTVYRVESMEPIKWIRPLEFSTTT